MNKFIIKPSLGIKIIQTLISLVTGVLFLVFIGQYQSRVEVNLFIIICFILIVFILITFLEYLEVLLSRKAQFLVSDSNIKIQSSNAQTIILTYDTIDSIQIKLNNYESKLFIIISTKDSKEYKLQLITVFLLGKRRISHLLKNFSDIYKPLESYLDKQSIQLINKK